MNRAILLLAMIVFGSARATADDAAPAENGEAAIRQTVESYVAAFNQGEAAKLAAHWADDAQFITPGGETYQGRQAIQEGFEAFFKDNPDAKLEVTIGSIRIEAEDAAVEEGTARLTLPGGEISETSYAARYGKQDGQWKLTLVRETVPAPSHYEQLKELEWLIGEWEDREEGSTIHTVCRWTKNRNFISRSFAVSFGDQIELEGTQVIGWDPDKQVIRSWLFDSDGGFAVGLWTRQENQWSIRSLHVLNDGRKASSVNLLTYVDENTCTWESTDREVAGEVLPNLGPVTVVRKPADNEEPRRDTAGQE